MNEFTEEVRKWASKITEIRAVILFGSRARGDHLPGSDWDVCILLEKDHSKKNDWYGTWSAWADSWHTSFCKAVKLKKSEVQFVAPTSDAVKAGIAKSSKVLYISDNVTKIKTHNKHAQ